MALSGLKTPSRSHASAFFPPVVLPLPVSRGYRGLPVRLSSTPATTQHRATRLRIMLAHDNDGSAGLPTTAGAAADAVDPGTSGEAPEEIGRSKRPVRAPASAWRALDDARKLVRARRQSARKRHSQEQEAAAAAAAVAWDAAPERGDATVQTDKVNTPGSTTARKAGKGARRPSVPSAERLQSAGRIIDHTSSTAVRQRVVDVDVAKEASRVPHQSFGTQSNAAALSGTADKQQQQQKQRRTGNRYISRRRVLPDFTALVDELAGPPFLPVNEAVRGSAEGDQESDVQNEEDAALIAALRATLASTESQLDELKAKAAARRELDKEGTAMDGVSLHIYDKPQVFCVLPVDVNLQRRELGYTSSGTCNIELHCTDCTAVTVDN